MTTNKSMPGQLLGAIGHGEAFVTALNLAKQLVAFTINLEQRDPACNLDYVSQDVREASLATALYNSLGFEGTNACLAWPFCDVNKGH